jgi:hypothetical protein
MNKNVLISFIFLLFIYQLYSANAVIVSANETYTFATMKCYGEATLSVITPMSKTLDYRIYKMGSNCTIVNTTINLWKCVCNNGNDINFTIKMLTNMDKTFNIAVDRYIVEGNNPTFLFSDNFNEIQFVKSTAWNNKWFMETYDTNVNVAKSLFTTLIIIVIIVIILVVIFFKYRQYVREQ